MFINFWYVAEESQNVIDQPVHVRMLGQDFVLFRDTDGAAHCLSNVCIHRGGSLGHGKLKGDCVECPYHGWRFDGAGICRRIPSLGSDTSPPARAKIDSYPIREKYGFIFAFLGDLPEASRPPIMPIPEWGDDAWRSALLRYEFNFDYKRSIENGVDLAHNEYTHSFQMFTRGDECFAIPQFEIEEHEGGWEYGIRLTMPGATTGLRSEAGKTEPGPTEAYTGFHGVSSLRTLIHHSATLALHQYIFETPIDKNHTRIFFHNFRNYLLDPGKDAASLKENETVVYEDRDVLERLRPVLTPATNTKELLMPADKSLVCYRDRLKEFEARGWRIDIKAIEQAEDAVAFAIPSPARRESAGWVIDSIPLIPSDGTQLGKPRLLRV
ncbi:MAG: aromatic ring-hydroxylating dioxygenase subunit alpha [Gammaproteobacteria bacterium]|nr:aromatic ring-hydroxylating dioxygenase subunit alpha [Gammaproteobacteria bacterium]